MKPVEFAEVNKNLLKPQGMTNEECGSLSVYTDGERCISKWEMTWKERLHCFLWLCVDTSAKWSYATTNSCNSKKVNFLKLMTRV